MKHILLLGLVLTSIMAAWGKPNLVKGIKYHIICNEFPSGCVVDGSSFGQTTPLYYSTSATTADASYWLFTETSEGLYTIQNAATRQYITFDGERIEASKRYISMTPELHGDSSVWSVSQYSGTIYTLRCAASNGEIWDVRRDSYMVGTYNTSGVGGNQQFFFQTAGGSTVQEYVAPVVGETGINVDSWLVADMSTTNGWDNQSFWVNGNGYYVNGNASIAAPFIENWHNAGLGGLADSHLLQTAENLPNGSYTVTADFIATDQSGQNAPEGAYFVVNGQSQQLRTLNGTPLHYNQTVTVTDGKITTGVNLVNTNCNWVAIDNLHLLFNGTADELLTGERQKILTELQDYYDAATINHHLDSLVTAYSGHDSLFAVLEMYRKSVMYLPRTSPIERGLGQLIVGQHGLAYDEEYSTYLQSIPEANFGHDYTAVVQYTPKAGYGQLYINGQPVASGSTYTFKNVAAESNYVLSVTDSLGNTTRANLTFTCLPVVQLFGSFNDIYSQGYFRVYEPNAVEPELLFAKAKWRGGITNNPDKHKRNYHVKLLDASGQKLERKFFGLRNDNSWILEAGQVDMSRIRNRVLTDLWNDFATKPYYYGQEPKALTGTRGQFVELLLNGRYVGLYCMTEAMDRKQMKLKKYDETTSTQHGLLWKSSDWSYSVFMGHNYNSNVYPGTSPVNYNNSWETWDNYESKYPDYDDYNQSDWEPLWNAVNFVCTASDNDFRSQFNTYFDYPVIKDYYILMESELSADNHGKNMYFGVYDRQADQKVTIGVWDMDATLGQRWSDYYFHNTDIMNPERDYAEYITNEEHGDYNLFRRLRNTNANNFNEEVRQRYAELRKGYLSTASILSRFSTYLDRFKLCGAAARESRRWSGDTDIAGHTLDFDDEMAYITDWVTRRMNYLDNTRFKIGELTGIETVSNDMAFSVGAEGNNIVISSAKAVAVPVYSVNGSVVRTVQAKVGTTVISGLPSGLYVVGHQKVVIR
ncbi:MAG: CotH kinase family protein [Prevotella sp.]|nr:CotH kinase family protein [Prevotella sp.]